MDAFSVYGTWWAPDDPSNTFDAVLEYGTRDGPFLKPLSDYNFSFLLKKFGKQYSGNRRSLNISTRPFPIAIMLGVAEGRQYTLINCEATLGIVMVSLVIEGKHFDNVDSAIFDKYSIKFTGLDQWGASGRLERRIVNNLDGTKILQLSYETYKNEPLNRVELNSAQVDISRRVEISGGVIERHKGTIMETTELRISPKKDEKISVVQMVEHYSNLFRNFMMLATWQPVAVTYTRGWYDKSDPLKGQSTIYWHGKGAGLQDTTYDSWLFSPQELGGQIEDVLQKWEQDYDKFQPLIRNYLAHRYISENFLEVRFLAYMQGLEAYHKLRYPNYKPNMNKPYPCDKKKKSSRGRKATLADRLIDAMQLLKRFTIINEIANPDIDTFSCHLAEVRNALNHEADRKIPLSELDKLTDNLEIIIILLIYEALGIPEQLIEHIMENNPGFRQRARSE